MKLSERLRQTGGGKGFPWNDMQEAANLLNECEIALAWYEEFNRLHNRTRTLANDTLTKLRAAQEKADEVDAD